MCGLAGVARREPAGVSAELLTRMAAVLRHRGPDGFGLFVSARVGLAHLRLSIIDIAGGAQPLANEDGRVVIVYNGEVYNYLELRRELAGHGHRFRTESDTEVLVHAYEEWGTGMLERLNGQFAFAIYDRRDESLFLARDRFGVRPLFYAEREGTLYFASEMKALFASGEVDPAVDAAGLDEVFTFWAARPPRTPFREVRAIEPGCYAVWRDGRLRHTRYFSPDYPAAAAEPATALNTLDDLLRTAVDFRMRADVPVGGYLSGGLDSTIGCALAAAASPHDLRTFSVTFEDPAFDESAHQLVVAGELGSRHAVQAIGPREIGAVFPDVVWHAETPLVRTAPAPLFLLSRLTRERDIKVVLTGEGADELFLGYDLFKEVVVRRFCLRQPGSTWRPRLFDRLYPYLAPPSGSAGRGGDLWRRFFLEAGSPDDPLFSHLPRFHLTARTKDFYAPGFRDALSGLDPLAQLRDSLPPGFARWSPLHRAAYLEVTTLLSPYLLSSQGDRMAMAHGVEGRFPFLDHRLFAFAAGLPEGSKLRTTRLREKDILRRWAAPDAPGKGLVPERVRARAKQPYRAPDIPAFFGPGHQSYVDEVLAPEALRASDLFEPAAVAGLVRRCRTGQATGARENQALVGILSAQLWHRAFIAGKPPTAAVLPAPDVFLHDAAPVAP
jgi:asparagine synthase (glutamine-hydrolysing)